MLCITRILLRNAYEYNRTARNRKSLPIPSVVLPKKTRSSAGGLQPCLQLHIPALQQSHSTFTDGFGASRLETAKSKRRKFLEKNAMVKKYLLPPSIFHSIVLLIRSIRSGDPTTAWLPTHDTVYLFISQACS